MTTVTATDLARHINQVLDALARGESVTIIRNNAVLGTINPPVHAVTLREAFERIPKMSRELADRYRADILHPDFDDEVRDHRCADKLDHSHAREVEHANLARQSAAIAESPPRCH